MEQNKRLYILIRADLKNKAYQAVQAGYCVAQFMLDHPDNNWKNQYLIYLSVKNQNELLYWLNKANQYQH